MKLQDCKIGEVVIVKISRKYHEIGHIVGFTHNINSRFIAYNDYVESRKCTVPLVRFPDGSEHGIFEGNLELYKDGKNYEI